MPRRKALDVMLDNGECLNLSEREYWDQRSAFQQRVGPRHFMRLGQFAVAVGDMHLAVHRAYDSQIAANAEKWQSLEYRASFARGRRRQLGTISDALDCYGHPWEDELRAAMQAELDVWTAMGE